MANQNINNYYGQFFRYYPIIGWSFDSIDEVRKVVGDRVYDGQIEEYKRTVFDEGLGRILFESGIKFDLGGQTEKSRIVTTDIPQGVFDFSLASKGLFRVQEFFSPDLFKEKRNIFSEYDLPLGVVPVQMINEVVVSGEKKYVFTDSDGKDYYCIKQQKGTAAIAQGIRGAKLKFATKTKKVYLKFKRLGGRVNYVEIYSMFHYQSGYGELGYALRHIPALMVCQYFESIGIKTRFYPTRYVRKGENISLRKTDTISGALLPMYEESEKNQLNTRSHRNWIIFQPILAKEYGQDVDYLRCLATAPNKPARIYNAIAEEAEQRDMLDIFTPYGSPSTEAINYREAFERFKNKSQIYIEKGLFNGKEVTPECQIYHISASLNESGEDILKKFASFATFYYEEKNNSRIYGEVQLISWVVSESVCAKKAMEFWIRIMALKMRDYIALLVTKEPIKEMKKIAKNIQDEIDNFYNFFKTVKFKDGWEFAFSATFLDSTIKTILQKEKMNFSKGQKFILENPDVQRQPSQDAINAGLRNAILTGKELYIPKIKAKQYIESLINEATIFAEGAFFPTPKEDIEKLDNLVERLLDELQKADLD